MATANLERLPAETKAELGGLMLRKISRGKPKSQDLWALSRFGGRVPFYGPQDQVVSSHTVSLWMEALLSLELPPGEATAHALVQLARCTGDRVRDVPREIRDRLSKWLEQTSSGPRLLELLHHPETSLMGQERDWIFGESLPSGLVIGSEEDE